MGSEKRLYERLEFSCRADCAYLESFPEIFSVTITDIGPQGIGFVSEEPMPSGTSVFFSINLGDDKPVKFIAQVRWVKSLPNSKQHQIGAKLLNANEKDLGKIIRFYCQRLTPVKRKKKIVLVIGEIPDALKDAEAELRQSGCDPVFAEDDETGFAAYISQRPDLVVLIAVFSGALIFEVYRKIRKLQEDQFTPIIIVLSAKKEKEKEGWPSQGPQKVLSHPIDAQCLVREVKELLS